MTETGNERFIECRLNAQGSGEVTLLEAVRRQQHGRTVMEVFLKSGPPVETIRPGANWDIASLRSVAGAPVILASAPEGCGPLPLSVGGETFEIAGAPAQTALFEGLDTGYAERNGESAAVVLDWLAYHVRTQKMQAALILDRAPPEADRSFVRQLRKGAAAIDGLARLVVLRAPVPLGRAGLGDEAHPMNAPEAPGKDRMEPPAPDPWRAPLGEGVLFELVRARFLGRAGAVMNIDVFDLLLPHPDGSVFERARKASTGCITLEGRHCYPWRVRKNAQAGFGDHICVPFDLGRRRQRWCLAPQQAAAQAVWRFVRVVGATPGPEERATFYRCMALRHRVSSVSRIVPKTSLIEDERLVELVRKYLAANPVRMPEHRAIARDETGNRTTIVTTMKNEGPFILEWLAYHRAIGVSDFLIYTNDCTDGTDTMLAMLQDKGIVQHRQNPYRASGGTKPQHAALQAADNEELVRDSDWLICMDVDEFINIHAGGGHLRDLFEATRGANMISLTWRLFGNSDLHRFVDRPVIEQFDRCAPELIRKPHQAWGFKTLFRNEGIFKKLGVHRPKGLRPQLLERIRWVNGSGQPMPERMYRNAWRSTLETYGYELATLNHYAVRSAESFLVKRDRGRVNHVDRDQGLNYWFRMNNNAEKDTSIQRMLPAMRAELDRLMSDPEIRAAHAFSVARHREKIRELKAREDYAAFYSELTGPRLEKLSRLHGHFGASVFLAGPGAIPDEIVRKTPGDRFTFTVEKGIAEH